MLIRTSVSLIATGPAAEAVTDRKSGPNPFRRDAHRANRGVLLRHARSRRRDRRGTPAPPVRKATSAEVDRDVAGVDRARGEVARRTGCLELAFARVVIGARQRIGVGGSDGRVDHGRPIRRASFDTARRPGVHRERLAIGRCLRASCRAQSGAPTVEPREIRNSEERTASGNGGWRERDQPREPRSTQCSGTQGGGHHVTVPLGYGLLAQRRPRL